MGRPPGGYQHSRFVDTTGHLTRHRIESTATHTSTPTGRVRVAFPIVSQLTPGHNRRRFQPTLEPKLEPQSRKARDTAVALLSVTVVTPVGLCPVRPVSRARRIRVGACRSWISRKGRREFARFLLPPRHPRLSLLSSPSTDRPRLSLQTRCRRHHPMPLQTRRKCFAVSI